MPWHDMSDGGVLALVHQEDGRHLHSAPHRSPDWASERWWLREDGFEFPGARQLGNRPIRPRAAPTSKVRKILDTTGTRGHENDHNLILMLSRGGTSPSLPKGAQYVILTGDPTKALSMVVQRVKLPPNYQVPAHTHPHIVIETVLTGSMGFGTGDRLDTQKGGMLKSGFAAADAA